MDEWRTKAGATLATVPKDQRVVDVMDAAGHLFAVLVAWQQEKEPPAYLLLTRGDQGPVPAYALVEGGLAGVMTSPWINDVVRVDVLGDGMDSADIVCHECLTRYTVPADSLRGKAETRGQRVPRLTVDG